MLNSKELEIISSVKWLSDESLRPDSEFWKTMDAIREGTALKIGMWEAYEKKIRNEQRKVREAELESKVHDWALKNVKRGMILKFKGTKDGHGLREVVGVREHPHGTTIECYKLEAAKRGRYALIYTDTDGLRRLQITEHKPEKIIGLVEEDLRMELRNSYFDRGARALVVERYTPMREVVENG